MSRECVVEDCFSLIEIEVDRTENSKVYLQGSFRYDLCSGTSMGKRAKGDIITIAYPHRENEYGLCWYHKRVYLREITPLWVTTYNVVDRAVRNFLESKRKQ